MKDKATPKIGTGHAEAMFRQGLAELRGAFYSESNVAQPAQYGLYGTRTPGEIAEARRADGDRNLEEESKSVLGERLVPARADRPDPEPPERGTDRD